jgi:hypothetical protein
MVLLLSNDQRTQAPSLGQPQCRVYQQTEKVSLVYLWGRNVVRMVSP